MALAVLSINTLLVWQMTHQPGGPFKHGLEQMNDNISSNMLQLLDNQGQVLQ